MRQQNYELMSKTKNVLKCVCILNNFMDSWIVTWFGKSEKKSQITFLYNNLAKNQSIYKTFCHIRFWVVSEQ